MEAPARSGFANCALATLRERDANGRVRACPGLIGFNLVREGGFMCQVR